MDKVCIYETQIIGDPEVSTMRLWVTVRKLKALLLFSFLINFLTIGFVGYYVYIKEFTRSGRALSSTVHEMRQSIDVYNKQILSITENNDLTQIRAANNTQKIEALEKLTASMCNLSAINEIREQITNLSKQDEEIKKTIANSNNLTQANVTENIRKIEVLEKLTESMSTLGAVNEIREQISNLSKQDEEFRKKITDNYNVTQSNITENIQKIKTLEKLTESVVTLNAINEIREQISNLSQHNKEVEKTVTDYNRLTQASLIENTQKINTLEKMSIDLRTELEDVQQRFNKDENLSSKLTRSISSTDEQVMDVVKGTKSVEAAYKALKSNFTEFLISRTGSVLWKISEWSKIEKSLFTGTEQKGPSFYTSQFGYKIQLGLRVAENHIRLPIYVLRGEYDNLLRWPFSANGTLTLFDQSEKPNNFVAYFYPRSTHSQCFRENHPAMTHGGCEYWLLKHEELKKGRRFIKDDTLYLGVKIETEGPAL